MSDEKNMLNGSEAVKMEINSKPATNSCDFSQCSSSGTTVAQETGNLKLRSKICDWNWVRDWDWGRYYFRFVHRLFLSFACSFSIASSVLILMLLPHPCCFEISRICRWDRFRYTDPTGSDPTQRATSSQCTHLFCMNRLFPSVGPEVFMSFVTNRQGSQITDFGKLLQGGWLMRNEKPSEKKQENIIYKTFSCLPDDREKERDLNRFPVSANLHDRKLLLLLCLWLGWKVMPMICLR